MLFAVFLVLKDVFIIDALSFDEIVLMALASVAYEFFRKLD